MNKKVELLLTPPIYSTNHGQACVTSIFHNNKSMRNWYLNNAWFFQYQINNPNELFVPNVDNSQSGLENNNL